MILAARAKIRGVVRSERRCERAGWASELGKLKVVVLRLTKQNYASAIVRLPSQEGLERRIENAERWRATPVIERETCMFIGGISAVASLG